MRGNGGKFERDRIETGFDHGIELGKKLNENGIWDGTRSNRAKGLKGRLELMECPDFDGRREVEGCMMDGE